jgi:hypothetical protein
MEYGLQNRDSQTFGERRGFKMAAQSVKPVALVTGGTTADNPKTII